MRPSTNHDAATARKVTGVYYTPAGVVEYLVQRTVGRLLDGWSPAAGPPLRILDPACGEGAFLLGAYQFLLDGHLRGYVADGPEKHRPRLRRDSAGEWRLSVPERARILRTSIFGVDIDPRAAAATRRALLRRSTCERGQLDLSRSIRCGNALIGSDLHDDGPVRTTTEDERLRIRAFDWETEFPDVFCGTRPGFDAVVGNPPYLSFSGRQAIQLSKTTRAYFRQRYSARGWLTAHGMFIEAAVKRLSRRLVAYVVPDQVGHLAGYGPVRQLVTQHSGLVEVRYWGERVFPGVVTPALTFIADRDHRGPTTILQADGRRAAVACVDDRPWVFSDEAVLLARLRKNAGSLGRLVADPGVHTGNCAAALIVPQSEATPDCVPILEGKQVARYRCDRPTKSLRLAYQPRANEYFRVGPPSKYAAARFVIRQTAPHPIVGPRLHADHFRNSLLALYAPANGTDIRYLVGLLNSRLMRYIYRQTVPESGQRAFPQVKLRSLRDLPIRLPDLDLAAERARHDRLVTLVERMLELQCRLAAADGLAAERLARRASATDRQIDRLVYEVYQLTGAEIRSVEDATR